MEIAAIGKRLLRVANELVANGLNASWHVSVESASSYPLLLIEADSDLEKQVQALAQEKSAKKYYNKVVIVTMDEFPVPTTLQLPSFIIDIIQFKKESNNFSSIVRTLVCMASEKNSDKKQETAFKIPISKRWFDIIVSTLIIMMISPFLLVIMILIKLESHGPIVYKSPRVGTGYKVFPFYKFRSMRPDADKLLEKMKHLNHYAQEAGAAEDPTVKINHLNQIVNLNQENVLIGDDYYVDEPKYAAFKQKEDKNSFVKINNDPRITRVGKFIRNTSMDELPQLFNVLLGHMSIVGNRPLPLYEAEKLTSDEWSKRFMAPAGITGLWQVTERGKKSTSENSRKILDIKYAENYSLWMDLKILAKTPLAALQHENV